MFSALGRQLQAKVLKGASREAVKHHRRRVISFMFAQPRNSIYRYEELTDSLNPPENFQPDQDHKKQNDR
jgi:hypothetical protein